LKHFAFLTEQQSGAKPSFWSAERGTAPMNKSATNRTDAQLDLSELIDELIEQLAAEIKARQPKQSLHTSVSDLLRLVEAKKELEPEQVKEVIVKWIEPNDPTSSNG
jgi:hypothetical protein